MPARFDFPAGVLAGTSVSGAPWRPGVVGEHGVLLCASADAEQRPGRGDQMIGPAPAVGM